MPHSRPIPALLALSFVAVSLYGCASSSSSNPPVATQSPNAKGATMDLGNFSVSLNVKNLTASREFYEKLGFKMVGGDGKGYAIMQNPSSTIGLFQGMFEKNMLTFNPGWDRACNTLPEFTDVRDLQKSLIAKGITPTAPIDSKAPAAGPAYFVVTDPDGNPILFDQHTTKK